MIITMDSSRNKPLQHKLLWLSEEKSEKDTFHPGEKNNPVSGLQLLVLSASSFSGNIY